MESNGRNLNDTTISAGLADGYRISWVGYIRPITKCLLVSFAATCVLIWPFSAVVVAWGPSILLIPIAWISALVICILQVRSIRVYANQAGVWRFQGIFPWNKSISGVRWHAMDEALTINGLLPWVTRAYSVVVLHRYTKQMELWIPNVARGDEFVARINGVIGQRYAGGPIVRPITSRRSHTSLNGGARQVRYAQEE